MTEKPLDLYGDESPIGAAPAPGGKMTPFGLTVLAAAILMIGVVLWAIYDNSRGGLEGGPAPEFTLPLIGAEGEFDLAEHRGNVVVINFWGSWCPPCRAEAPMLQSAYADYQSEGVVFVGIAVDDTATNALAFMDEFGITYPNVMDIGGEMEDAYRTQGVPETFVIDRDGDIHTFFFAPPPESDLRAAIEAALET
ncbi:MAG: TlpA family protein disulfide reductase [Anaerolineales bacterium]